MAHTTSTTIEREPITGAQADRNPGGDFLAYLGIDPFAELAEDASDAIDELYDEMTIFDYSDCNRYWNASLTEEDEAAIIDRYADRIWDENGTPRTC